MFRKVAFTMYPVQDWKRARAFYGETLGLKIGSKSPDGVWTEYDLPGGGCLALFGNKDMNPTRTRARASRSRSTTSTRSMPTSRPRACGTRRT